MSDRKYDGAEIRGTPMHMWRPRRLPPTMAHRQNGSTATRQKYKGKPQLPNMKIDLDKIKELTK